MKKAQVTLFIVIAIVIIAAILLIIFLTGGFKTQFSQAEISQVKGYIQDCLRLKTQEGILFIAKQGGYNVLPEASINFLEEKTAYYFKDNQTLVPSISTFEQELASWLDAHTSECLKMPGYALTATTCKSNVEIKEKTEVLFDCPVTIQKGMTSIQLKEFSVEIEAPITKMLDVSSQVVEEYSLEYNRNKSYICMDCFKRIVEVNNVSLTIVPITKEIFEPEHMWFLIADKNIKFDDKNITWRFVTEL
ncbi:MAG: hypothetical protein QW622_03110 [Candidatus Pacearchaeota archaeon]